MSKILIVDDERTNLSSTRMYLNARIPGNSIITSESLEEAAQIILNSYRNGEPIDVLLTDLIMRTSTDGIDLISRARAIDPEIICILFTANEKNLDRSAAYSTGAFEVIEKNAFGQYSQEEIAIKISKALEIKEKHKAYTFLRKYFDPEVASMIEQDKGAVELKQKNMTIVFWDIRGFSKLCETLKEHPRLISGFLDEFTIMASKVITDGNGILDKFMGDGVMALFGYLADDDADSDNGAKRAVQTAIELRTKFGELVELWIKKWERASPEMISAKLGCGIHTGPVLVGEIGSNVRAQFTAVGAHVNFAARIEGKATNGEIIISQSTKVRVQDEFKTSEFTIENNIKNIPGSYQLYSVE